MCVLYLTKAREQLLIALFPIFFSFPLYLPANNLLTRDKNSGHIHIYMYIHYEYLYILGEAAKKSSSLNGRAIKA